MYIPKYQITNKILKNIGIIEASKEVINHAPLLPYYEKEFQKEALVRTVHHGTHIEGNELNLSQAEKILTGQDIAARERDIQEVINYRKVIEFIGRIQKKQEKDREQYEIDDNAIKEIHKITVDRILEEDKRGKYRETQVVVRNSLTREITFRPPMAVAIEFHIKDLLEFINNVTEKDMHPVLKSGVVHYELARIHPFLDGNGRVARALATLVLYLEDYDIRRFFSLEEYFDKNAIDYYDALQSVEKNNGDLTRWLEYFTLGLSIELSKIKEKVENISIDAKLKEKLGGKPLMLTERQLKIVEYIQKTGYLQNKAFNQLFPMVSEDTVLNELKVLLKMGIVKKHGVTKSSKYAMA